MPSPYTKRMGASLRTASISVADRGLTGLHNFWQPRAARRGINCPHPSHLLGSWTRTKSLPEVEWSQSGQQPSSVSELRRRSNLWCSGQMQYLPNADLFTDLFQKSLPNVKNPRTMVQKFQPLHQPVSIFQFAFSRTSCVITY